MTSPGRDSAGTAPRTERGARATTLLARVADGDEVAFAALYDEAAPTVYGTALRVLRDRDHAAEVTQEVMTEVWRTAARFDAARGSALAWISTMGHRRAVDRVRAVQSQRDRDGLAAQRSYERPYDDVQETVERTVEQSRVQECLGGLSDLQRDAVLRAFYGGRSYREVAADTGAALPTIKSRIRDGLIRLRDCLGVD
ncbi:ECF RNA polymerase sigma factor SigK [Georgenia wangjunii]|uniref:ECF RNA polymerase sigma factor SigK n=1 Tax=Georgenia wangjunii TaxID=3117730 RepID=UPI002F26BE87